MQFIILLTFITNKRPLADDLTVFNQSRMEKGAKKMKSGPREKDFHMNLAVWGLLTLAFITMSLKIITLHHLMFPGYYYSHPSAHVVMTSPTEYDYEITNFKALVR